jgi:cyclic-di-GMP-binding protein
MPSFDVVSEINLHELANAVDQTQREIATRFDFKDADAQVEQTKENITLDAESEFQINQMLDILYKKLAKRGIDVTSLEEGQIDVQNRRARLALKIKQGIETEMGKKIVKLVKDSKLKVQATIQGDQVRVTGKKLDDLQQVITMLRGQNLGLPLQFSNFRD